MQWEDMGSNWLTWNDSTVVKLAQQVIDSKYDLSLLPILADAVEEAGGPADLVRHCRISHVFDGWCYVPGDIIARSRHGTEAMAGGEAVEPVAPASVVDRPPGRTAGAAESGKAPGVVGPG